MGIKRGHRVALLLRGIHRSGSYLHFGRDAVTIDYTRTAPSIFDKVILPIRSLVGKDRLDVFCASYDSDVKQELQERFEPVDVSFTDMSVPSTENTQVGCMLRGLDLVAKRSRDHDVDYDWVIVTRFDLAWKRSVLDIDLEDGHDIHFLWRERETWETKQEVNDCVHFIRGNRALDAVSELIRGALLETAGSLKDLHWLYRKIIEMKSDNKILPSLLPSFCTSDRERFNSNTDIGSNPFYVICRVPQVQRYVPCFLGGPIGLRRRS